MLSLKLKHNYIKLFLLDSEIIDCFSIAIIDLIKLFEVIIKLGNCLISLYLIREEFRSNWTFFLLFLLNY
jgi:hypothetical protein